jgi:hypothetical protein
MVRGRREERRDDRPFGPARGRENTHSRMRQRLLAFGDDFWIEDEQDNRAFTVDGKAVRVRQTLTFEDAHGQERCKIRERMLRVKDSMASEGPRGERIAMVEKALISPVRDRLSVQVQGGPDLAVTGTSWTTSAASARAGTRWPRSPRSGPACATPPAWRSSRARTTPASWRPPSASTS